ncbi:serine/threonine-protein kinase dbf2 [Coemansia sp. RSA 989]|nr:serine/threonine-protein kinase dbf2 [Coemansia sp. RSA 1086]KAJ1750345.1 serine/threonine-protein kinase dbf2 [Coemansia sp. RSA 1821]KAJ1864928.1 serine/threonine-protein kinase dbf2 [Coemansia sp. RSA 989]KAJ1873214.1 serine/threonine-protein kinase dbf2 [Coemansia sp. RSA 990]KAJ2629835.1 serine/threonine-protein kinase dbf2 [Coemansia sp. RSA 1290]KAJ2649383.1 serine/threonine-protein kinase dbf2 [Coemansia sp. RSA 1250]KAJ2672237.1 serine/threonine-protein kinase dbf2 [Coemansia sp. 
MAERGSMDAQPHNEGEQPWLAYAEANNMMHTFETIGRSVSASSILEAQRQAELWIGSTASSDLGVNGSSMDMSESNSHGSSLSRRSAFLSTIDPSIRRKIEAAQVYFLDYYVDHLTYIANRRARLDSFKAAIRSVHVSAQEVQQSWVSHQSNETNILRRRRNRTREHEFDILAQIGQGGFGQVFLVRKRDTGEVCALKKMEKQLLVKLGEVQHILTERDILRTSRSEWLVKLLYAFQDRRHLYLAMEFVPGGDIRSLLIHSELFRHPVARFYIAEAIVAVSALHSFGYFHRDLKPENFLVDASGHVKLTDFGLSHGHLSRPTLEAMRKKLDRVKDQELVIQSSSEKRSLSKYAAGRLADQASRAFSIVGSPDYMAPEILYTSLAMDRNRDPGSSSSGANGNSSSQNSAASHDPLADAHLGYDFRVDFWSLGCILYEFYASYSPFTGPTADDVWRNVFHWEEVLQRPDFASQEAEDNLTPEAWDLITALVCHRDIRLSSLAEIAKHSYFRGMDMLRLRETQVPPFIPALQSDADTRHFDDFSDPVSMAAYKDVNNKWKDLDGLATQPGADIDPAAFIGFTYKHNRQHRFI